MVDVWTTIESWKMRASRGVVRLCMRVHMQNIHNQMNCYDVSWSPYLDCSAISIDIHIHT